MVWPEDKPPGAVTRLLSRGKNGRCPAGERANAPLLEEVDAMKMGWRALVQGDEPINFSSGGWPTLPNAVMSWLRHGGGWGTGGCTKPRLPTPVRANAHRPGDALYHYLTGRM